MHFEDSAGVHFANHGGTTLLDGLQSALQDVARAEAGRFFEREKNVSRANGDADGVSGLVVTEGRFDCGV